MNFHYICRYYLLATGACLCDRSLAKLFPEVGVLSETMMKKRVCAVEPYIYPGQLNFKDQAFRAWKDVNGNWVKGWYPKWLHALLFRWDLFYPLAWFCRFFIPNYKTPQPPDPPTPFRGSKRGTNSQTSYLPNSLTSYLPNSYLPNFLTPYLPNFLSPTPPASRLIFVQPVSLYFDAGVSVIGHEVIPMVWDCWPCYYDKMERWMKRHRVRQAFFTSRQEMEAMQLRCPAVLMKWCPEAVESSLYAAGKALKERSIDVLEFGRGWNAPVVHGDAALQTKTETLVGNDIKWVRTQVDGRFIYTDEELRAAMGDAKVTICLPRSMTHPALAQGVETLTQRYWEAMLSRMVIVGHAPQELIDILGYNPVVEMEGIGESGNQGASSSAYQLIRQVLEHIGDYQALVDRNREAALRHGDWKKRIEDRIYL